MSFHWRGQPISLQAHAWYNLSSRRFITNIQSLSNLYALRGVDVVGMYRDVYEFWTENQNYFRENNYLGSRIEEYIFQPTTDVNYLIKQAATGPEAGHTSTVCTTDVSQLTPAQLESLSVFTLGYQFLKCKVTRLIDGDTFEGVVYLPLRMAGAQREGQCPALVNMATRRGPLDRRPPDHGMFIKITCRMYGYDAMEIRTAEGKLAFQEMSNLLHKYAYTVWLYFVGRPDKYGRHLVIMYADQSRLTHLNNHLITRSQELGRILAKPYLGGHKS